MSAYDCTTELNFTNVADGMFYTPDNLPANGTATLSKIAGTVSVPPSGTLFSYTNYFDSTVYTITAAVDGKDSVPGSVTGLTVGASVGSTNTGTGAKPTITSESGATGNGPSWSWRFAVVTLSAGLVALLY